MNRSLQRLPHRLYCQGNACLLGADESVVLVFVRGETAFVGVACALWLAPTVFVARVGLLGVHTVLPGMFAIRPTMMWPTITGYIRGKYNTEFFETVTEPLIVCIVVCNY
jgi:hypothetical protein